MTPHQNCLVDMHDTSYDTTITTSLMHTGISNMLMWQRIKEERGVRVSSVHACIGKHIFCEE